MNMLDAERLNRSDTLVCREPFSFLSATDQLPDSARTALQADFPRYSSAGYFPHSSAECGPAINELIAELNGREFAEAIGSRLGIENLGNYPVLITICRSLNRRHGTIHTDSRSKIATALLYLNESWPDTSAGCLRFLRHPDNIDDQIAPEVRPVYGNLVAFRRSENSYHGHLPCEGERRVIQIAWVVDDHEKQRKTRRGNASRLFKKLFAAIDRRIGARRKDNAAHLD